MQYQLGVSAKEILVSRVRRSPSVVSLTKSLSHVSLCLLMGAFCRTAQADTALHPVHLHIAGRELTLKTQPLASDSEVYVPLDVLRAVSAEGKVDPKGETVKVSFGSTRHTQEFAIARPQGKPMLALSSLAHLLNARLLRPEALDPDGQPVPGTHGNQVYLLAKVTDVRLENGSVRVKTSFPIPYKVEMLPDEKPPRGYIDCMGSEVADDFKPAQWKNEPRALHLRAAQYNIETARIVLEVAYGTALKTADSARNQNTLIVAALQTDAQANKQITQAHRGTSPVQSGVSIDHSSIAINPKDKTKSVLTSSAGGTKSIPIHDPGETNAIQRAGLPSGDTEIAAGTKADSVKGKGSSAAKTNAPTPVNGKAKPANAGKTPKDDGTPIDSSDDMSELPTAAPPSHPDAKTAPQRGTQPSRGGSVRSSTPPKPPGTIEVHDLTLMPDGDNEVRINIASTGRITPRVHYLPDAKMTFDLPNTNLRLTNAERGSQTIDHPLMTGVHAEQVEGLPALTRITIDTTRIVGFTVNNGGGILSLDLRLPRNANGVLADKVIVVDAGHGGSSTGATGGGIKEKNITLQMALKLRAILEDCGAKVVMTRDRDIDVPLYDRPHLANDIDADLFVSIHNDSNGAQNSATGTSTYYHMNDPSSRALANIVQQSIIAVSGIPSRGALSDGVLYASGLAVLRVSTMPAILVEVAYINNTRDRRMLVDDAFQQRVAQAICDGLRSYVEGSPSAPHHPSPMGSVAMPVTSPSPDTDPPFGTK